MSDVMITFGADVSRVITETDRLRVTIEQLTVSVNSAIQKLDFKPVERGFAATSDAAKRAGADVRRSGQDFNAASDDVKRFRDRLDMVAEFAWQNTNLSGDQIDRIVNPLKALAGTLGVMGAVGAAGVAAVGGAIAFVTYRAYEAEKAVRALSDELSLTGQINAFAGLKIDTFGVVSALTKMASGWDVITRGAALSNEEAQKLTAELSKLPGLTDPIVQGFVHLAREERYALGAESTQMLQNFVAALRAPETALQTLINENLRLTPAQRAAAQAALESGNAQKQTATYFELVTKDLIAQRTDLELAGTAQHNLQEETRNLASEAIAAAAAGREFDGVLQKLAASGVSAAAGLQKTIGVIRTIQSELNKGLNTNALAGALQNEIDKLDPASAKVRTATGAWKDSLAQVEQQQAKVNAAVASGDADKIASETNILRLMKEKSQLLDRDRQKAVEDRAGQTSLDAAKAEIDRKYLASKDELAKAQETTRLLQAKLHDTPDNEHFEGARNDLTRQIKESQQAEREAAKATTDAKMDYDITKAEEGEATIALIKQKYAKTLALKPGMEGYGTADYWTKMSAYQGEIDSATPSDKGGKANNDQRQADMKAIDDQIRAAQQGERAKASLYADGARMFIVSEDEKIAATRRAVEEEYQTESALLAQEAKIANLSLQQKQAIEDKKKALDIKYNAEREKLLMESIQVQLRPWHSMVDAMSSSLNSSIMGMIRGTENFRQAMAGVANAVIQQFVKMGVDMVATWAKNRMFDIASHQTDEGIKTAATLAGVSARTSIVASGAAVGAAAEKAATAATISGDASKAAAGAWASAAQIPVVGYVLAPAAAAAAYAGVMAFGSFDVGAWQIDQNQLAMVHKNEMVMTAGQSEGLRNVINAAQGAYGGGAGAGGDTHHNYSIAINAVDSASVRSLFANNAQALYAALKKGASRGDHL